MMPAQTSQATTIPNLNSREAQFLDWFAVTYKSPGLLKHMQVGNVEYYRNFQSFKCAEESFISTGRADNPRLAAIKSAAEFIERWFFIFKRNTILPWETGHVNINSAGQINYSLESLHAPKIPKRFQTTSGWAVHFSKEEALKNALLELMERHCLLLSFIQSQWNGFQMINELEVDGIIFRSLTSSVHVMGYQAGLVIAERKNGKGASFGYMLEKADQILTSQKWLHAMQEAYDLIETFRPHAPPPPRSNALETSVYDYLTNDFSERQLLSTIPVNSVQTIMNQAQFELFDLSINLGSPVPLYAAHVWSPDLLPLFATAAIKKEDIDWLNINYGGLGSFDHLPMRSPIL